VSAENAYGESAQSSYGSATTQSGDGPVSLTDGEWHDGNITVSGPQYYRFSVVSGENYEVYWNDRDQGNGSKNLDIKVSAYYETGEYSIFSGVDRGYYTPQTFTATSSGEVILKVEPYSSLSTGTYAVKYGSTTVQEANTFKNNYSTILSKTVEDIATTNETTVNNALADYDDLTDAAKALLTDEKALLDSLKAKIGDLKTTQAADTFKNNHSAILSKTVEDIATSQEWMVNDALAAYDDLTDAAKALLTDEKALLDSLKARIEELPVLQAAAATFQNTYSVILAKTVGNITPPDETEVDKALAAYSVLPPGVRAMLSNEKNLLDGLKTKIGEIKADQTAAAAFLNTHSGILDKTVEDIATTDETEVDNALADYSDLSQGAQAMLVSEKNLLESLKAKIAILGHGSITLVDPTDVANNALDIDGIPISKTGDPQTRVLAVIGVFDSYRWRVDGSVRGSGNTLVLSAADYATGTHQISLEVTLNGAVYSQSGSFTVES
jgi:hypothetical protein